MSYAVVKGTSYVLVHTPDMILHNGTTQTTEKQANPNSEYLKKLPEHLRNYQEVVSYPPNQAYIGTITPEDLRTYEMPWYNKQVQGADRYGKFGEIMPQDEFIGLMKIVDAFDLVK
ncbi:betaine reductase, partial [Natronincola peptidivorans]